MDTSDFMQSLFCCIFPMKPRRRKHYRKPVSAPLKRSRRRPDIGRGPDRHRRMIWLHSRANYVDFRNRILEGITYDTTRTIVVWCPQNVVPNDFVLSMLHQHGEIETLIDNYTRRMRLDSRQMIWAGTIVEYSTRVEASSALKAIPMECRHVKALPLDFVLSLLIDCELLYGQFSRNSTSTVVITGRRSLECVETMYLRMELSHYGEIDRLFFNYQLTTPGTVCQVTYPYLTQAYLAMMMLEGNTCDRVLLSAEIEESDRDEEIISEAKKSLMVVMESYFPN